MSENTRKCSRRRDVLTRYSSFFFSDPLNKCRSSIFKHYNAIPPLCFIPEACYLCWILWWQNLYLIRHIDGAENLFWLSAKMCFRFWEAGRFLLSVFLILRRESSVVYCIKGSYKFGVCGLACWWELCGGALAW
jgi:hypothetical protein